MTRSQQAGARLGALHAIGWAGGVDGSTPRTALRWHARNMTRACRPARLDAATRGRGHRPGVAAWAVASAALNTCLLAGAAAGSGSSADASGRTAAIARWHGGGSPGTPHAPAHRAGVGAVALRCRDRGRSGSRSRRRRRRRGILPSSGGVGDRPGQSAGYGQVSLALDGAPAGVIACGAVVEACAGVEADV